VNKFFKNNAFIFQKLIQHSPKLILSTIAESVAMSIMEVCATMVFVRTLISYVESGKSFVAIIPLFIIILAVIILLRGGSAIIQSYIKPLQVIKFKQKIETELFEKAKEIDLEKYDNEDYYNKNIWAMQNAAESILNSLNTIGGTIRYILSIIGTLAVIFTIDSSIIALIVLCVILSTAVTMISEKYRYRSTKAQTVNKKRQQYIQRLFTLKDAAFDFRLTHLKEKIIKDYHNSYDEQKKAIGIYAKKLIILDLLPGLLFRYFVSTFFIYGYFTYKLIVLKTLSISDFVAINAGMVNIYLSLTRGANIFTGLYQSVLNIDSIIEFINYQPKIKNIENAIKPPDKCCRIEFRNVSFRYSNKEEYALQNVSFTIEPNKTLAIVGYNGAGKSTIIKLLLRLYDVESGEILLNGVNIKEYDIQEYRNYFSAMMQNYQIYAANIDENIMMDVVNNQNDDLLNTAINFSTFNNKFAHLPLKYKTPLTREFNNNGILLSGGETQKLAIARTVVKTNSKIFIFDEPSSALDPFSESQINQKINMLSKNNTVVLVSHRLSGTVSADMIIVMDKGKIVESGSHNELMVKNGLYSKLFNAQAEHYAVN